MGKRKLIIVAFAYRIAFIYLIFGIVWIALSDKLLELLIKDTALLVDFETYKGIFFIFFTTILLYVLVRRHEVKLRRANEQLEKEIEENKILNEKYLSQNIELKRATNKALENEKFLSGIIENIPNLVFVKNVRNGTYLLANKSVAELMGLERVEIIGKDDFSLFPKVVADRLVQNDFKAIGTNSIVHTEEHVHTKDGLRILNTIRVPLPDFNGQPKYLLGVSEDITPKREAELELIAAKEKAEEGNTLKTAFLQNITHEIRTPMNAICGFSGLLLEPDITLEQKKNFSAILRSNCDQLLTIITDVLTISSLEKGRLQVNMQEVDLTRLMHELTCIFTPTAISQGIDFNNLSKLQEEFIIETDKTKLTQILSNLITNAIKFTKEGHIEIECRLEADSMIFQVKDTGIGIKQSQQDNIFERFSQGGKDIHLKYGGTGLGLAISKAFVELLGGNIAVESKEGVGSIFTVSLPCNQVKTTIMEPLMPTKKDDEITILIAEDEDMNYLFLETLLKPMKWKLIRAHNGQEAIDLARSDDSIRLILMDIRMPILNGQQAAIRIKKFRPNLPIIAQTAYALDFEVEQYQGIFDDYMTKPLRAQFLKQKVLEFLA
jgi:PAS domain S-box-containing protein